MNNLFRKPIVWILLSTFVFSLSYSFYFQIRPTVDAKAYDRIAVNLVEGNGYRESNEVPLIDDNAIVRVGPGFPFFLAGIYKLFGHNIFVVWIIHSILITLSAFLIYLTSLKLFQNFDERRKELIALISAGFIGFSPDLITINGMLMSETLAVFLVSLTLYLFFLFFDKEESVWHPIFLALALGLAVLVRTPVALLFIPIAFYFLFRKRWKSLLVFVIALIFIFSPWAYRNYQIYDSLVLTNLAYGVDLMFGNHPGATGELEHYDPPYENIEKYGYVEGNRVNALQTLDFVKNSPLEFVKLTLYRTSIYFSFARPTGFWFHLSGLSMALTLMLSAVYSILIFTLSFWGIYKIRDLINRDKEKAWYLLSLLIMMPLAVIFIIVETRYRFLAYPILALFTGLGVMSLPRNMKDVQITLAILILLLSNTLYDVLRNFDIFTDRLSNFL
jgi:4-amino-4-deoxy-L-arabinose transferase-like glycosyltransferase